MSALNANSQTSHPDSPLSFAAGDTVLSCEPWVWSFAYQHYNTRCANCFEESGSLLTCSKCKLHRYCDTSCQLISWKKEHKHECEALKTTHSFIQETKSRHMFDLKCLAPGCCNFGCFSVDILWAKVLSKIDSGQKESLPGFQEKMDAVAVLQALPHNLNNKRSYPFLPVIPEHHFPPFARVLEKLYNSGLLTRLAEAVHYNALPLSDPLTRVPYAAAIFPQCPFRTMTPVCWDTNVTMVMHGRTLRVIATEDIAGYSGMEDLRENELLARVAFFSPLECRRKMYASVYLRECSCRTCTNAYDAEINPLKCATKGCTERIPSDERALHPCPQCGALNGDRLLQFKGLKVKLTAAYGMSDSSLGFRVEHLARTPVQLDELDLLHGDAYFYVACNAHRPDPLLGCGQFAQAWKKYTCMVTCVRAIFPRYHFGLVRFLLKGCEIPRAWIFKLRGRDNEKFFDEVVPTALEWIQEAHQICIKLSGPDSKETKKTGKYAAALYALLILRSENGPDLMKKLCSPAYFGPIT